MTDTQLYLVGCLLLHAAVLQFCSMVRIRFSGWLVSGYACVFSTSFRCHWTEPVCVTERQKQWHVLIYSDGDSTLWCWRVSLQCHANTLASASAPALAMNGFDGWNATSWIDSSNFLRCDVISCTHVLLSRFHRRMEQSWPAMIHMYTLKAHKEYSNAGWSKCCSSCYRCVSNISICSTFTKTSLSC